jgi:hypothetical protein
MSRDRALGRRFRLDMAIIQKCGFQKSPDNILRTNPRRAISRWGVAAAILAVSSFRPAAIVRAQQIEHQGGSNPNSLVIPRVPARQSIPSPPLEPSQNVLVIPKASTDFVGEWGGHVVLQHSTMGTPGRHETVVSLAFGERNGEVFMQTTAFAGPNSRIVSTSARVIDPHRIEIKIEGTEYDFRPPLRHVEELHLALTRKNTIDCLKFVDFYVPGHSDPLVSMDYHGTLRTLTAAEREALRREVTEQGEVPQGTIESSRHFGP